MSLNKFALSVEMGLSVLLKCNDSECAGQAISSRCSGPHLEMEDGELRLFDQCHPNGIIQVIGTHSYFLCLSPVDLVLLVEAVQRIGSSLPHFRGLAALGSAALGSAEGLM